MTVRFKSMLLKNRHTLETGTIGEKGEENNNTENKTKKMQALYIEPVAAVKPYRK